MKKLFTLLSVVCAFVFLAACSSSSNTPSGVVEKYAKGIKNENYEAVAELFHFGGSNEESAEGTKMIAGLLEEKVKPEMDKNGGVKSYEIGTETISEDGESATVEFTFNFGNGESDTQESELVNIDGQWYLDAGK